MTVAELGEFARQAQADARRYPDLPVPPVRALALSVNPAASKDDVAMLVAHADGRCVGYLGTIPCWIRRGSATSKAFILSSFFVSEGYRGKGVADALMKRAMELGHDCVTGGNTKAGRRYFETRTQWFVPGGTLPFLYVRFGRVFPVTGLLQKLYQSHRLRPFRPALRLLLAISRGLLDALLWPLVHRILRPPATARPAGIEVRHVLEVRAPDAVKLTPSAAVEPRFHRDERIVNWMIHYPWITEDPSVSLRYFFSYRRERFRFVPLELTRKETGEVVGYAVFSVSTKDGFTTLKILDHRLADPALFPLVLDLALRHASRWKAQALEGSFEFWPFVQGNFLFRQIAERRERSYYFHPSSERSPLARPEEIVLDYCDVDIAFV